MVRRKFGRSVVKVALLVEGPSDVKTMPILVKRILGERVRIISRNMRGRGGVLNRRKVEAVINEVLRRNPDLSKVIVCVDSECTSLDETEDRAQEVRKAVASEVRCPVHYVVVGHALEGWLLADVEAVRKYLKGVVPITPSATLDCKPKEVMRGLFRKAGRNFLSDRDGPKMAEMMDLDRASKRNKSLATFREILKDP